MAYGRRVSGLETSFSFPLSLLFLHGTGEQNSTLARQQNKPVIDSSGEGAPRTPNEWVCVRVRAPAAFYVQSERSRTSGKRAEKVNRCCSRRGSSSPTNSPANQAPANKRWPPRDNSPPSHPLLRGSHALRRQAAGCRCTTPSTPPTILLLADWKQGGAADMKASPLVAAPLRKGREGKETPHFSPLCPPWLLLVRLTSY